jgi:hypothetical protein
MRNRRVQIPALDVQKATRDSLERVSESLDKPLGNPDKEIDSLDAGFENLEMLVFSSNVGKWKIYRGFSSMMWNF